MIKELIKGEKIKFINFIYIYGEMLEQLEIKECTVVEFLVSHNSKIKIKDNLKKLYIMTLSCFF